jgi:hypothetical protein
MRTSVHFCFLQEKKWKPPSKNKEEQENETLKVHYMPKPEEQKGMPQHQGFSFSGHEDEHQSFF